MDPDLEACAREPIHIPGSIQPYGLLLVIDPASEQVVQAAGDATSLIGLTGSPLARTTQDVLGVSLADLARRSEHGLQHEPTYLDTVRPSGAPEPLNVIAHQVQGDAILELTPVGPPLSGAQALASIRSVTERIAGASSLVEACRIAASEVRRITGYDRVMVYQFLDDGSGAVIAEDKAAHLPAFLNHRYPESDIPRQARELYRRSTIRVIAEVDYTPAPLVPDVSPRTHEPLDMSYCTLRSVSPVHIRYLKNMNVGASMSVSLLPRGELWGLIACHNTTARRIVYEAQEACRHVGQILSHLIRAGEEAEQDRIAHELDAARDTAMRTLANAKDAATGMADICPRLQAIARADGVAVTMGNSVLVAGHVPPEPDIRRLAAWLEPRLSDLDILMTDRLCEAFPDAAAYAPEASGLLATTLPGAEPVTVMWFRVEQIQEVMWAGNPHAPFEPGSSLGNLNPRSSFATWTETVRHRSRPWSSADIASVRAFRPRAGVVLQQQRVNELNDLLRDANERLTALASTDGLTGIANRRAFDNRLREEWARARRSGSSVALVTLDLDFFKQYNDHFGHPAGDECLKQIAGLLQEGRRAADFAARVGGEEFSLLLSDTNLEGALAVAEATRRRIEDSRIDHPKSPFGVMTASVGVACAAADGAAEADDLMKTADRALYKAKIQGRNRAMQS